jgi:hypothetical protein
MFSGPPLPLSPDTPLQQLLALADSTGAIGAWLRGGKHSLSIYGSNVEGCRILLSSDLGSLLGRCNRVIVRQGSRPVAIDSVRLIEWRSLQVVTATPYLPGVAHLREQFAGTRLTPEGVLVPMLSRYSPEEILAECVAAGLPVRGSQVVYVGNDGRDGKGGKDGKEKSFESLSS